MLSLRKPCAETCVQIMVASTTTCIILIVLMSYVFEFACKVTYFSLIFHIFAKKLPADLTAPQIAAARAFYAMPALIVLLAALYLIQGPFLFDSNATLWGTLLGSAVVNYVIGNILWYHAIRNMDLSKATAIILCYPVFTFILSVALGQDTLSTYKILGMALAVGGAYMVTSSAKKQGEHA